jgi:hypothetical protein
MEANIISAKEVVELIKIRGFANTFEASIYLGKSIHYIRRLSRDKALTSYKPNGKCIYFKMEDLDGFLLNNKLLNRENITQKASKYLFNSRK